MALNLNAEIPAVLGGVVAGPGPTPVVPKATPAV
jgi:hypothetical protein